MNDQKLLLNTKLLDEFVTLIDISLNLCLCRFGFAFRLQLVCVLVAALQFEHAAAVLRSVNFHLRFAVVCGLFTFWLAAGVRLQFRLWLAVIVSVVRCSVWIAVFSCISTVLFYWILHGLICPFYLEC